MDRYQQIRVHDRTSGPLPIHKFREHLSCFSNVESITFFTLELIHQVGGFTVSKGGDGIGQIGVGASKHWVGVWDMFYSRYGCREGSFQGGEEMRAETSVGEDLAEVG